MGAAASGAAAAGAAATTLATDPIFFAQTAASSAELSCSFAATGAALDRRVSKFASRATNTH